MKKSIFYDIDKWNPESMKKELSDGWAVYRIWQYSTGSFVGTLVTFESTGYGVPMPSDYNDFFKSTLTGLND